MVIVGPGATISSLSSGRGVGIGGIGRVDWSTSICSAGGTIADKAHGAVLECDMAALELRLKVLVADGIA